MVLAGWRIYNEDPLNWSLIRGIGTDSLEIPKKGKAVSFDVLYHCLSAAELPPGDYFELLATVRGHDLSMPKSQA